MDVGRKRLRHIPFTDRAGGEDDRRCHHLAISPAGARLVVHAEFSRGGILAHGRSHAREPRVIQLGLNRGAKVLEEGARGEGLEHRILVYQVGARQPLAHEWRIDELRGTAGFNCEVEESHRLKSHRVGKRRRAQVLDLERGEARVPRLHKVRPGIDDADCETCARALW